MNTNTAEKLEEGTEVELENNVELEVDIVDDTCLLYTSPSPRDRG